MPFRPAIRHGPSSSGCPFSPASSQRRGWRATSRAFAAILCSPRFLYFYEEPGKLDSYSLASRLSYFLWNSMPDKTLFDLAAEDKLTDEVVIAQQVERMLKDKKAEAFIRNFLRQWLNFKNMVEIKMDFQKLYGIGSRGFGFFSYPEDDRLKVLKHSG